jgi:hypothetical protein
MIRKKPAPHLIRGVQRFSEKHALGLDPRDHAPIKSPLLKFETNAFEIRRSIASDHPQHIPTNPL